MIGGVERAAGRTTPEAIDLQADFRAMLDGGDGACAIEVSSHALELGRADGIHFAAAIFTNLTQDHLDFHDDMEDYFQAKRRLFQADPGVSVVNVGDPYGRRLAGEIDGSGHVRGRWRTPTTARPICAAISQGCRFALHTPAGEREVALPMPGRFNVANALGALAAVHALGGELDVLVAALERGVRVPGRFEAGRRGPGLRGAGRLRPYARLAGERPALRRATIARGRVVCVFGAGGDRDRGKRPLMGEIAARLADVAIVTSDNPRSEDPEAIIAEILAGVAGASGGRSDRTSILDRGRRSSGRSRWPRRTTSW